MTTPTNEQLKTATASARLYFVVAMVSGLVLLGSHVFDRVELQTINARFELRRWLNWAPSGLAKLNPWTLWQYHEQHEIPRRLWAWDYTLSWLLADNHPPSLHKFVIFNHQLEDEPPLEALPDHPWMQPLVQYPLSRRVTANNLLFLARSGAAMIIMDNDFPQYTADDTILAQAIISCCDGSAAGHPVPVLMARTVNHHSYNNILQLEVPTAPSGLIAQLKKLKPQLDALEELTGSTGVSMDEDQVVRRLASRIPTLSGPVIDSIPIKSMKALHELLPQNIPLFVDIDFAGPPNSEIYPIRPISYLLDPQKRKAMSSPGGGGADVNLKGAVVILGDSVVDLFNTPTTNSGVNQMSGAEILANSIDTLTRRSWLTRLNTIQQIGYLTAVILAAAFCNFLTKTGPRKARATAAKPGSLAQLLPELVGVISVIVGSYVLAALIFAKLALIVPVVVPTVALTLASLAAVIWERAQEKAASLERDLKAAEEKFSLQSELHKSELARQKAVGEAREAVMDRERRQEFARRINHDLRAPVSVLSWTIAKLRGKKLTESERAEKIDRLTSTTDKLFALINELVSSYTADENRQSEPMVSERCDVDVVLTECIKIQQVLAEQRQGSLTLTATVKNCLVEGDKLKLSRVVDNIVRNAFLHNEKGTSVSISLTSDSGKNIIRITDNGQGIEKEHLEKIFTAGYRIGKTAETAAADGQGLGLDIALSFVENMKGSLQVESTVGEGTTFIISLPAAGLNQSGETMTDQPQQDKTENERDAEAQIGAVELMETKEVKAKR